MIKRHIQNKACERDYLIQKKVPKHLQPSFDQWRELRNLPLGKEARSNIGNVILDIILNETSFLDQELIKKLDNVFLEGTYKEKLNLIVDNFLKWHEKFPYLTTQRTIRPEDAEFPPCPFVKAIYWEGKFVGFQCRVIKSPAFDLPRLKVGRLTLKVTTPDDCWDCVELCKKRKIGINFFQHINIKQIELRKLEQKTLQEKGKSEHDREITQKLEEAGIRLTIQEVETIFKHLSYNKKLDQWKKISKASKITGISRPSIYKLIKTFPEGMG
jgi:hypothetical protein